MRGFVRHHEAIEEYAIKIGIRSRPTLLLRNEDITRKEDQPGPALTEVAWHLRK